MNGFYIGFFSMLTVIALWIGVPDYTGGVSLGTAVVNYIVAASKR